MLQLTVIRSSTYHTCLFYSCSSEKHKHRTTNLLYIYRAHNYMFLLM